MIAFVEEFYAKPSFLVGFNSSFITLIPKVKIPIFIKYYRPISLIRLQSKIIAKLLANRLDPSLNEVIGFEQSAFLKGLQVLDGRLMVNELVAWYEKKQEKLMIFMVDFEMAYDSINWDYID